MRNWCVVVMLAMGLQAGTGWAAGSDYDLILRGAVTTKKAGSSSGGGAIVLDLRRDGEGWSRVWGIAGRFNTSWHYGFVTGFREQGDGISIDLRLRILPDSFIRDVGPGTYHVTLKKTGAGVYEGDFTGTCAGNSVSGKARATARPSSVPIPGMAAVQSGEHPRLLFRKGDVPGLKAKLATPFGQAMVKQMAPDAIKLGVLYQLTGEARYADEAWGVMQRLMAGKEPAQIQDSHHQSPQFGWYYEQASQAYDLCYDAWTREQRAAAENYLGAWAMRLVYHHSMYNMQVPRTVGNGEYMNMVFGAGLGMLARLGEKAPAPEKPMAPDPAGDLPAAKGFTPAAGVPVNLLEPGQFPAQWLTLPATPGYVRREAFADLASGKVNPAPGTTVTLGGKAVAFAPLGSDYLRAKGGFVINVGNGQQPEHIKRAEGPEWPGITDGPVTFVWYSVLDNRQARAVKVEAGSTLMGKPDVFVAGHALTHGQVVKLEPGLYPMLIVARITARWDTLNIRLVPATDADAVASAAVMEEAAQTYQDDLKEWEYDQAQWERTGGWNAEYTKMFELYRSYVYRHIQEGTGLGGAQPEFRSDREYGSGRFASAYRNALGYDLSPFDDLNVFLARKVFQRSYGEKEILVQEPSGETSALPGAYFAFHWPIIPERWKATMVWAWNREFGIHDPAASVAAVGGGHPDGAVYAFVNYPLEMKPVPPAATMPLTWAAPTFGYYGFRNGWKGDDMVVQIYAKSGNGKGYTRPNAGAFRIAGLGQIWADGLPSLRLYNQRIFDPVVELPDDDINDGALGRVTHTSFESDGSGTVTVDLDDVYASLRKDSKGNPLSLYEPYGGIRNADALADSGIHGLRAFGVDYSGLSGAPCLFVVVDKISGGKQKLWTWHLKGPGKDAKEGDQSVASNVVSRAEVIGNTVLVKQGDATMKLSAVAPAGGHLTAEVRDITYTRTYNRGKGGFKLPGIFLRGAKPDDGQFFVVATFQPKGVAAPEVTVKGQGLDAVVTVGKRTVRFDGEKVVFGDR